MKNWRKSVKSIFFRGSFWCAGIFRGKLPNHLPTQNDNGPSLIKFNESSWGGIGSKKEVVSRSQLSHLQISKVDDEDNYSNSGDNGDNS